MSNYAYRHELLKDDANLHPPGGERAKIIRACFAVANDAHAGESRQKMDPTIGYISHPIMVYDMLCGLGEKDPVLLGAAFLHDVLELDAYRGDPERMHRELQVALEKEGIRDERADELSYEIYKLVEEVTNPAVLPKAKELTQIDHARTTSLRAKKLKIVDQCASFICNVVADNDPFEIPYEKERRFKEKAQGLCHAIIDSAVGNKQEAAALEPYAAFFHRCSLQVNELFLPPNATDAEILKARMHVRHHFNFSELFKGPNNFIAPLPHTHSVSKLTFYDGKSLADDLESGKPLGLLQTEFIDQGLVNRCYLHVTQDPSRSNEVNQKQEQFFSLLRERLRWWGQRSEHGAVLPGQLSNDGHVRLYVMHPPMLADAFAAAAKEAGVCTQDQWKQIKDEGARLKREYDAQPKASATSGAKRTAKDIKDEKLRKLARRMNDGSGRDR